MTSAKCSTLVELLRWRTTHHPAHRAYTFLVDGELEEIHMTYEELDRRARAIGTLLQSIEATGERVLLLYPSGLEYITAFFGCLYAGAVAIPSYPPRLNKPDPRIQAIAVDAQATVALTTTHILSNIESRFVHAPELEALQWFATDDLADDLAEQWQAPMIQSDTLAFLQYTSGSTATPKGVMVSHGNLLYNLQMLKAAFQLTEQSTIVSWLPIFHDMGLIGQVLNSLHISTTCILMDPAAFLYKPFCWLRAISDYKAYFSGGPNFAYDLCVRKVTPEQQTMLDLTNWKVAFNGAEPVRHQTLERFVTTFEPCGFRREAFYPCYGLAEATLFVSGGLPSASPIQHIVERAAIEQDRVIAAPAENNGAMTLVGCGRTWLDQEIAIVDSESLTRCPPDRVGEIWASGPNIVRGYWNRAEETDCTFGAYLADTGEGPFLRTGDLGFSKDGELFITGRIKDLIIIGGRNLYPQDIELIVEQSHPALRPGCCAAFSVDVDDEEQLVIAAEVHRRYRPARHQVDGKSASTRSSGPSLDTRDVIKAVQRATTEAYGVRVYDLLLLKHGRIPKTSSGKVQRHACRTGYLTGSLGVWGGLTGFF